MSAGSQSLLEELQGELGQQEQEHRRVLEELRATHARQLEEQRDEQLQLTAQLHTLTAQLQQASTHLSHEHTPHIASAQVHYHT